MPVESSEMSIPCKNQRPLGYGTYRRARTFTHALTKCLNKREKRSISGNGAGSSYQTSHPRISAGAIAFGRSWPLTVFRYRPSSRYGSEGEKCRPLNHLRQLPLLHAAPDRPYQCSGKVIVFISRMVSTGVPEYKVYARALRKIRQA